MKYALLLDDDRALAHMTHALLVMEGFAVTTTHTTEEALKHMATWKYDLLLTDNNLIPGTTNDGIEFAKEHRQEFDALIVYTGDPTNKKALVEAIDGVLLAKPFRVVELKQALTKASHKPEREV